MSTPTETRSLLERLRSGDETALEQLLALHLDWIRVRVRALLGPELRVKEETEDLVQETLLELLRYGPRFVVSEPAQLRALLSKIAENAIRDRHRWHHRAKREIDRERPLPSGSGIDLDSSAGRFTPPPERVERNEMVHWLRLGLRLLISRDREMIIMREWEGKSFVEIGELLDIPENAARMRFQRAVEKLSSKVVELRSGDLEAALES